MAVNPQEVKILLAEDALAMRKIEIKILKSLGFNTGQTESAIIPVMIGDELTQKKMSKRFHEIYQF